MNLTRLENRLPSNVLEELPSVIEKFEINTKDRLANFLAQTAHESGNFRFTEENLNYSSKALIAVFGKYFTLDLAEEYHRKPINIASRIYANRMGNGDEISQEGWKYRGRGFIQLTGKKNYILFNNFVPEDVVTNPDIVSDEYPLLSAGWFWFVNDLNTLADLCEHYKALDSKHMIVKRITRRVNGGYHGLQDRTQYFNEFYSLI